MPWETMSQTGKVPPQPTSLHNGLMKTHHTGVAVKMQPSPMAAAFGALARVRHHFQQFLHRAG